MYLIFSLGGRGNAGSVTARQNAAKDRPLLKTTLTPLFASCFNQQNWLYLTRRRDSFQQFQFSSNNQVFKFKHKELAASLPRPGPCSGLTLLTRGFHSICSYIYCWYKGFQHQPVRSAVDITAVFESRSDK